jgi:SAM-dependent methyltransferase
LREKIVQMAAATVTSASVKRMSVPCHACACADDTTYIEARGYRIAECTGCGLWFVNPQPTPEELRHFYATYDDGEQWRNLEEHFNSGVRKAIRRLKSSGSILDVGCGSGNFLRCMKQGGFSTFGIEPSGSGSEYARTAHGIDVYRGMIEDYPAQNPNQRFDVITLLNVLEHLTRPAETLLQLRRMLASDGVLAIVVPDARFHDLVARFRRLWGVSDPYWIEQPDSFLSGFKLPDHLSSFQPRTVILLLQRCGFQVVVAKNAPIVLNPTFSRNLAKQLVCWISNALQSLTLGRILIGYSTLVLARKVSGMTSPEAQRE